MNIPALKSKSIPVRSMPNIKKQEKNEFKEKYNKELKKTKNIAQYSFSLPLGFIAMISGIWGFISSNLFNSNTEQIEKVAIYSNKASFFSGAISGVITNFLDNNIFGMVGLGTDFITALGPPEFMYTIRGYGSGLDSMPLTAENAAALREDFVNKYFKDDNGKPLTSTKFVEYPDFKTNIDRTFTLCKEVVKDTKKILQEGIKSKNSLQALWKLAFKGEFHLLTSTVGLISGASTACLGMLTGNDSLKVFGARARDFFGFQSDWGVWRAARELIELSDKNKETSNRALSKEQKKWQGFGDLVYQVSGITSYVGTIMDFIFRFKPFKNLHLAALGVDRFAQSLMVFGMFCHGKKKEV